MAEDKSKKRQRKETVSQQDIYPLLQRYSVTTVLTLLKEVAQAADKKIDWNGLVKKTATGISNAREYQMIWRHLAYRKNLEENIDGGAVPMDDDSDIEFELESHPPVSGDASTDAAACVKVMIASASLIDANLSSVVEAPLSISIPSGWSSTASSTNPQLQEMNINVPVLVPKQPVTLSTVPSVECLDGNDAAGGNPLVRKRRKPWSKKEEQELVSAVQKYGEGNWATILKEGDFKDDRTPSQLSQRWAVIKKRKENSSVGVAPPPADLHAVRMAFKMALDMPMGDSKSMFLNGKGKINPKGLNTSNNSTRPTALSPDAWVKATAVAVGARVATESDAATFIKKATQSKNAVHVIPSGPNSVKPPGPNNTNALPPNVHYIRTGLVTRSTCVPNNAITNSARPVGTHQTPSQITRPSLPTEQIQTPAVGETYKENKMIETTAPEEKGNKLNTEQNRGGKGDKHKMIERQVEEVREVKKEPEENGGRIEKNKAVGEERELKKKLKI